MTWDPPELDLLAAFKQRYGLEDKPQDAPPDTRVLEGAQHVYDNAIDVSINTFGVKDAARTVWQQMQQKEFSTETWSKHELHPKTKDESTLNFIFTMDLLNFSFWSERDQESRFCIEYKGKKWTGYWSLVAALQRALDDGIPITDPHFWHDENECTVEVMRHVFRSATDEEIPLLDERLANLREAGRVLYEKFDCSPLEVVLEANGSAAALVNLLASNFSSFRDETYFEEKRVRLYKRAQIFVADVWACFNGESYGEFDDIDNITAFADYRIPQMLYNLGCISYSPPLDSRIRKQGSIETGHSWEIQIRGCSIWAVELLKKEIKKDHPEAKLNSILIDFYLYDTSKELEASGDEMGIPHHRTRSIWY